MRAVMQESKITFLKTEMSIVLQGHMLHLRTDHYVSYNYAAKFHRARKTTVGYMITSPFHEEKLMSQEKILDFPLGSATLKDAVTLNTLLHDV